MSDEDQISQSPKFHRPLVGAVSSSSVKTWEWERVVHGLGVICIEFQILETVIKTAIGELVAKDDPLVGSAITAGLSFKTSIDVLYTLFEYQWEGSSRPKELQPILARCITAESKRNQLIHSNWYEPTKSRGITRVKFTARFTAKAHNQRGLRVHHETVTPADMDKIAEELRACRKQLASYLYGVLHPSEPP